MKTERRRCRETVCARVGTATMRDHVRVSGCGGNRIDGVAIAAFTAMSGVAVGLASSCSPAAQQLSASACETVRVPVLSSSDVCIEHAWPSTQQAIRASGVACQPPHRLTGPADITAISTAVTGRAITSTPNDGAARIRVSTSRSLWARRLVQPGRANT